MGTIIAIASAIGSTILGGGGSTPPPPPDFILLENGVDFVVTEGGDNIITQ
jgi:hypothetical protein